MKKILLLTLCFFPSCLIPGGDSQGGGLTILSWNVQNLFDDSLDGTEYDEYIPSPSGWGERGMRIRMERFREVLDSIGGGYPDILLLQEIENRRVLEILNKEYLKGYYSFVDAWTSQGSAISLGVLSRRPPRVVHLHFPGKYQKQPLRPLVELHLSIGSESLVLFNNHWKSRRGGQKATEGIRVLSAELLSRRIQELRRAGVRNILVAGDLNGSREDYGSGSIQSAQIPVEKLFDSPYQYSLYVSYNRKDTRIETNKVILYSPWKNWDTPGSYFYQARWSKLDHFLVAQGLLDGVGLEYETSRVVNLPLLGNQGGTPAGWQSWSEEGYSDHFPLFLSLKVLPES